jgi:hypothetical protein
MSLTIRKVRLAYPLPGDPPGKIYRVECEGQRVKNIDAEEEIFDPPIGSEEAPPVSFDSQELDGGAIWDKPLKSKRSAQPQFRSAGT